VNRVNNQINNISYFEPFFMGVSDKLQDEIDDNKVDMTYATDDVKLTIHDKIVMKDIVYAYPNTEKRIFDGANLTISIGDSVGIVGTSGAGKSTYMVTVCMSLIAKGEKIILVSNESQISDVRIQFLVWVLTRCLDYWKISKKKLTSGNLTEEDKAKIKEARQWWKKNYAKSVKIVTLSDADARLTCQIIKRHILRDGCTTFLVDTFKLTTDGSSSDAFWMSLIKDTRDLTSLAMKYNVIGLMTVQLALNSLNRCWIDASCLSHSRAIKETLSNLIMFRKITDAELDPNSPYFIHPFRSKQRADGSWYEEPYQPDRSKIWRCFFIDKSRRGADSNDTGIAYLVRYDGDFCTFYETAKCRPTHKLINTEGR
jgi:energy-coupling factor transporter ATP-binding protein EcfA2